jgi:type IV pilus assembly protein PilQ
MKIYHCLKVLLFISILKCLPTHASYEITSMKYLQEGEISKLIIEVNKKGINANRFHIIEDKQIILDLKDTTGTAKVLRPMDVSEFSGSMVFLSAYKKSGNENDLRIAIQLRDNVRSILSKSGKKLILSVENRFGVFTQEKIEKSKKVENKITKGEGDKSINIPRSTKTQDILDNLTMSGPKKYVGKRISLNVKEIEVPEILRAISDSAGFNLIMAKEVNESPRLSLSLVNIPWDQALDTILSLSKLVAMKKENILLITTLKIATDEKRLEVRNRELALKQEPLITKIFPISYAKLEEIDPILKDYLTPGRASMAKDERTNSLIIKDTLTSIEKIRKIIETLDTQTPQILIESKIVEVSEAFSKELGLKNGLGFGYDPYSATGDTDVTSAGGEPYPGFAFSTAPGGDSNRTLLGFNLGFYKTIRNLDLRLQLMETKNKAKIISTPKVITQNKKAASITSSESAYYKETVTTDSSVSENWNTVTANMNLSVTPQVTNEGSIIMEINLAKSGFTAAATAGAPPGVTNRTVATNVLVDNGSTIVIGGVYTITKNESSSGIPYLKDLPLVGWLFRTAYNPASTKNELIIFLTPRIINQEEAGLVSGNVL